MLKAIGFGPWTPDVAPSNHLVVAKNVRAIANGYAPVGDYLPVTTSIGNSIRGGGAFIGSDGTSTLLVATPVNLRKYSTAWTTLVNATAPQRWRFAQFGDNVVYANGLQLGKYDLIAGTGGPISGAPTATDVATVGDFVMILGPNGNVNKIRWSGFNDSSFWTIGTNQSDEQPLLDGGAGVAIVGGEYGIVLQKNAIRRITYVGPPVIFQIDVISPEVGCIAQGSVCNVGRLIGFISERGFEICDGETVTPIGDNQFNEWFFSTFSRDDIANVWSAVDPRYNVMMWGMPGTPGVIICYNYVLKRATTIETDFAGLFTGRTTNTSLDALDAIYGNLDAIPVSLDDPSLAGGNPLLLVANNNHTIGTFTGSPLDATLQQNDVELTPGKRSRVRTLRPVTDAVNASATVNAKMRAGDAENIVSTSAMRLNGKLPIRANGRYLDTALTIPAGEAWTYVQGLEYEFEAGDGR